MWSALRRLLPRAVYNGSVQSSILASQTRSLCSGKDSTAESKWAKRLIGSKNPPVRYALYTARTLEESVRYLNSAAYKEVYGDRPVWYHYRRNLYNSIGVVKPRNRCFNTESIYIRANPCPLCRDEYLVVDYRNSTLLAQFLDPQLGLLLDISRVSTCKHQYLKLQLEIEKAFDSGYLDAPVPFRFYNYSLYSEKRLPDDPFGEYAGSTTLPHAQELVIEPPLMDIQRPQTPNRYAMEVGMRQRLVKKYKGKPTRPKHSPQVDEFLDNQLQD